MVSQAEWEDLFSKVGLNLVAGKRSSFGTAIFLCRRPTAAKKSIFLPVDDTNYNWVEPLKVRTSNLNTSSLSFLFLGAWVEDTF